MDSSPSDSLFIYTMCRKSERQNDDSIVKSGASDSLSPYDDDINRFFDKVNLVTTNLADLTKKVVGTTYDYASDLPSWKSVELPESETIDAFVNRPYQTRDSDLDTSGNLPFRRPFDLFNRFGNSGGRTPFGIYSYKGPSTRQYNDCLRKDGTSVWDAEGYWRCLFPNREVPARLLDFKKNQLAGQILTKEDFDEALREAKPLDDGVIDLGPKGIFFRHFNDFLNWKNAMYENVRRQREVTRKHIRESLAAGKLGLDSSPDSRTVVSSSVLSSMNTDSETNEVQLRETRTEVFSDGTSVTKYITKSKPFGSHEWATVNEEVQEDDSKNGWFWNSK